MLYAGFALTVLPAMDQPSEERRRRLRAARAYAGLSHQDLGERIGVSQFTVQRFEAGKGTEDAVKEEVFLRRSAKACGLPYEFFTVDWDTFAFEREAEQLEWAVRRFQGLVEEARAKGLVGGLPDRAQIDRELREQDERERDGEDRRGGEQRT